MKEKGQLLIETLIALAVINVALVALLSVSIKAIRVSRTSRNRLEAIKYAEGVIEGQKRIKESNQDSFFTLRSCPSSCGSFGGGIYTCTAICAWTPVLPQPADTLTIRVTMSWDEGGRSLDVTLDSVLTKAKL